MEYILDVLKEYNISPLKIESVTNHLFKVITASGNYALKKAQLSKKSTHNWIHVYHSVNERKSNYILPLYVTRGNNLFLSLKDKIYYLSPWIKQKKDIDFLKVNRAIRDIHFESLGEQKYKRSLFLDRLALYKNKIKNLKNQAVKIIEEFEESHYMSPVELQYCTHFHKIMMAFQMIEEELEGLAKDKLDETMEGNICLSHGNYKRDHYLFDGQREYVINWEKSSYTYPIIDLISLYNNELTSNTAHPHTLIEAFKDYSKKVKLKEFEVSLLNLYMLDPSLYFDALYVKKREIIKVKELEAQFRTICFGIKLREFIKEEHNHQSHSK